ncbi:MULTISPECIES: thiamine-phosphate kinase [unclassified Halorubrum]|uniref:thiamine-phosphate kinase n=1 Tax=unclassified Halorubrum TaxID=2642239 RepID=UPI000B97F03C|nr:MULTISPECIES: thiamine-phosphate kinase [unclassified Halorubrum]OYR40281.1 thiamine-phosphate kinase [Halorubrum sp. Eb13]OYR45484.1 thiamine-phosphate kinase [Halorubrum sp. Hd13]OYR50220.1 thiamine-phosphate kinase [Halorubrum sp. Ea8]OYR53174.1 thiamine-phosphate kinase [Halorubrum sp. Ea1]
MNERDALRRLAADLPHAGDDAAVVGDTVITTDMLHERTDFPPGTTRYTAGWRAVGASLSDVAAMGASATAAVAVYADAAFDPDRLDRFVAGAVDVCEAVDAEYVGGDLDSHDEFTTASTAIGEVAEDGPVTRSGAASGEALCVTGEWGRSAAALRLFERDDEGSVERANDLFRFTPRVADGTALVGRATAMMDSSDGLARSLHQLAEASGVGFALERDRLPVHPAVDDIAEGPSDRFELAAHFGEDFELVCAVPDAELDAARDACRAELTRVGTVVDAAEGVTADGDSLPDRGYTHG